MFTLPIIATGLILFLMHCKTHNWVRSFANTWLLYTAISWLSIELLGWFYVWNTVTVSGVWIAVIAVCFYNMWKRKLWISISEGNEIIKSFWHRVKQHSFLAGTVILFTFTVFFLALLRSPNNVDSLIYHLSRIMHWIQQQSARPYAAGRDLQIRYPALSEYLIAQFAVLGAHDRLFNLFQTVAYLSSGMMIFGIAQRFKVTPKIALLSTWIYWLIPMAMAQAFTTQTDDIAGLFLLIYIYFLYDFISKDRLQAKRDELLKGIRLAACIMFGYLCKPTICFAMVVFFVWMCIVRLIRKDSFVTLLKYIVIGMLTMAVLYTPSIAKCYVTYVTMPAMYAEEEEQVVSENMTEISKADTQMKKAANTLAPDSFAVTSALTNPVQFVMVCLQNVGRNSFSIYFPQWNDLWLRLMQKLSNRWDISIKAFKVQEGMNFWGCDTASAPAIMMISLFIGLCFVFRFSKTNNHQSMFVICSIVSFFLQCALMSYTPFRSRYLVGVMALLAISIGIVLNSLRIQKQSRLNIGIVMLTFCLLGGVNTFYMNVKQTFEGFQGNSVHKYFMGNPLPEEGNQAVVNVINANNITTIGINGAYELEYVLWKKITNLERLECVNLTNEYRVYEDMTYQPECIIWEAYSEEELTDVLECHGQTYKKTWSYPGYGAFYGLYQPLG